MTEERKETEDLLSMDLPALKAAVGALGEKSYRAEQIYGWLHRKLAGSWDEMTNVPAARRAGNVRVNQSQPFGLQTAAPQSFKSLGQPRGGQHQRKPCPVVQ